MALPSPTVLCLARTHAYLDTMVLQAPKATLPAVLLRINLTECGRKKELRVITRQKPAVVSYSHFPLIAHKNQMCR